MAKRAVVHVVAADPEPVQKVCGRLRSGGVVILDEQPHMLLVTGNRQAISRALDDVRGWAISDVTAVRRPRTRPQVLRKP